MNKDILHPVNFVKPVPQTEKPRLTVAQDRGLSRPAIPQEENRLSGQVERDVPLNLAPYVDPITERFEIMQDNSPMARKISKLLNVNGLSKPMQATSEEEVRVALMKQYPFRQRETSVAFPLPIRKRPSGDPDSEALEAARNTVISLREALEANLGTVRTRGVNGEREVRLAELTELLHLLSQRKEDRGTDITGDRWTFSVANYPIKAIGFHANSSVLQEFREHVARFWPELEGTLDELDKVWNQGTIGSTIARIHNTPAATRGGVRVHTVADATRDVRKEYRDRTAAIQGRLEDNLKRYSEHFTGPGGLVSNSVQKSVQVMKDLPGVKRGACLVDEHNERCQRIQEYNERRQGWRR